MKRARTAKILVAIVVIATGSGLLVYRLTRPAIPDREQILRMFLQVEEAVEHKNLSGVMRHIAEDYNDGTLTKTELTRLAIGAFREPEPFNVLATVRSLDITGEQATATIDVGFWVEDRSAKTVQNLLIQVELKRIRGEWQVTAARGWQQAQHAL